MSANARQAEISEVIRRDERVSSLTASHFKELGELVSAFEAHDWAAIVRIHRKLAEAHLGLADSIDEIVRRHTQ